MPIVKHICIHNNAKKSLRYILDPDKTEDLLYTVSINCMTDADLAYTQMKAVYEQFSRDHFDSPPPIVGNSLFFLTEIIDYLLLIWYNYINRIICFSIKTITKENASYGII